MTRLSTRLSLGLAAAVGLAGCMTAEAPTRGEFRQVTTEAEYRSLVANGIQFDAGDTMSYSGNRWAVFRDDAPIATGTWDWQGDRFCRQGRFSDGRDMPRECQIIEVSGDRFRVIAPGDRIVNGRLLG